MYSDLHQLQAIPAKKKFKDNVSESFKRSKWKIKLKTKKLRKRNKGTERKKKNDWVVPEIRTA